VFRNFFIHLVPFCQKIDVPASAFKRLDTKKRAQKNG